MSIVVDSNRVIAALIKDGTTNVLHPSKYNKHLSKFNLSDPKDIPYLACCVASNSEGIWSHDKHFEEQN